jgi:hypothetical protein
VEFFPILQKRNIGKEESDEIIDRLTEITKFGFLALKVVMDIELGYYFYRFKMNIQKK